MQTITAPLKIKSNLVITDEDQAILLHIRDNIRNNYFAIGDIANKYVVLCNSGKYAVNAQAVYDAVGEYVGKSGRTVRYYAEQAAFYHPETRDRYDILPFSFFVFARSMGKSWEAILDYCMEHPASSLSSIRRKFLYEPEHLSEETDEEVYEVPALQENEEKDGRTIGLFLSTMLDLSARALSMSQNMPIPEDAKQKLEEAAMQIRTVLHSLPALSR